VLHHLKTERQKSIRWCKKSFLPKKTL